MKGISGFIVVLILMVAGALAVKTGLVGIPNIQYAVSPTGHQYMILNLWGWVKCEKIGVYEPMSITLSDSTAWNFWGLGAGYTSDKFGCDKVFTDQCDMTVTIDTLSGFPNGLSEVYWRKCQVGGTCQSFSNVPVTGVPYSFNAGIILPNEYLEIKHTNIKYGYVVTRADKYGLRWYKITAPVDTSNVQNCLLDSTKVDTSKICREGQCDYPNGTLQLYPDGNPLSYFTGSAIGLSELNRINTYEGKQVYCDAGVLYGMSTYTGYNNVIYDYVDKSIIVATKQCCPGFTEYCGNDYMFHYDSQGQPVQQTDIQCILSEQCGNYWQPDTADSGKLVKGTCISNKCSYEYKTSICNQCNKNTETCFVNQVTGETECRQNESGLNVTETGGDWTDEYSNPPSPPSNTSYWIVLIVIIVVIVIILMSRSGRGGGSTVINIR